MHVDQLRYCDLGCCICLRLRHCFIMKGNGNQGGSNKRVRRDADADVEKEVEREEMEESESEGSGDEEDYSEDLGSDGEEEKEQDLAQMFYFFAKDHIDSGECKNFPKALAALKKVKNMVLERNEALRKLGQKALKRDASDTRVPPGSAQVQRTLTDERFLLCISTVLTSKIQLAAGQSKEALESLREALIWFPRCIEAHYISAEILRSNASSPALLKTMEDHLHKAIETGNHLREKVRAAKAAGKGTIKTPAQKAAAAAAAVASPEDAEITEEEMVMEIEAEELVAAKKAHECLIIVLCQSGRFTEAYPHLQAQGFKWRLSREVFNYPLPGDATPTGDITKTSTAGAAAISGEYVKAFDHAVTPQVVSHLQSVFRPDAPYWSEHNYDTVLNASSTAGYFSYLYPFRERAPGCSIEQIIQQHIYPAVCEQFPQASEANYAEWWVHSRPHSNGHQLHFDSDETRIMSGRAPAHPIVSSVLYLNDHIGGPTVVTNQRLAGPLATEGYMVLPKLNRMVMFDAQYLHGVIPGRGLNPLPHQNERRLTFMVGFWKEIAAKDRGLDTAGPGQPFPDLARTKYTWPKEMSVAALESAAAAPAKAGGTVFTRVGEAAGAMMEPVVPLHLQNIWEPVETDVTGVDTGSGLKKVPTTVADTPHYSTCFQGF